MKGKLSNGFEYEVDEGILDDMELIDLLNESSKDGTKYSDVVKKIFGEEQRKRLYDSMRTETGRVPAVGTNGEYSISKAITEVMEALGPAGKN